VTCPELLQFINKPVETPKGRGILQQVLGPNHIRVSLHEKMGKVSDKMATFKAEEIEEAK